MTCNNCNNTGKHNVFSCDRSHEVYNPFIAEIFRFYPKDKRFPFLGKTTVLNASDEVKRQFLMRAPVLQTEYTFVGYKKISVCVSDWSPNKKVIDKFNNVVDRPIDTPPSNELE